MSPDRKGGSRVYTSIPALMRSDVGGYKENLLTKEANHGRIYMN